MDNNNTEIALYIDIEGFSKRFESGGKKVMIELTNVLYQLGQRFFDHLLIIQFGGDGFLIKENLIYQNKMKKFVDLAVILLHSVAIHGGVGRVQISFGSMADIRSLYSQEIKMKLKGNSTDILRGENSNIMIINPTIGTSIINCYNLKGPKGPLLLVDNLLEEKISYENIPFTKIDSDNYEVLSINWLYYRNENTEQILNHLNLGSDNIESKLRTYIENNDLIDEWKNNALNLMA